MRELKSNRKVAGAYSFVLVAATALLSSCSSLPTSPVSGTTGETPNAGSNLEVIWNQLASTSVAKGAAATVSGGRYSLAIVRGGLGSATTVTLSESDPAALDVMIGPESTVMSKAGTLTIDYSGTPNEMIAAQLKLYRKDSMSGAWSIVAGTLDPMGRRYSAKVTKLGRYRLDTSDPGKAGW